MVNHSTALDAATLIQEVVANKEETQNNTTSREPIIIHEREVGVDPAYLRLLEEAKFGPDFASSHKRGKRGLVIGPTD